MDPGYTTPPKSTRHQPSSYKPITLEPTVTSFIFLGTGTSSCVPAIGCLTDPKSTCQICPSALHPKTQKNRRRNTSALLTFSNKKTILIDCGKSFFDSALAIWPRAKLRQISALLLTHAHADAINGLDDLRGWTLGGFIQATIEVYCSQTTFDAVSRTFPYMVDSAKATGGGDIPSFDWRIIDEDSEFFVQGAGVNVRTLPVEHGTHFDAQRTPFICLGFQFGNLEKEGLVSYISDASTIPKSVAKRLEGSKLLVLDALRYGTHPSHMGIPETLSFIENMERGAERTYLTDFTHDVDHYAFERDLKTFMNGERDVRPAYDGLQLCLEKDGFGEIDLLAERDWIAISEARKRGKAGKKRGKRVFQAEKAEERHVTESEWEDNAREGMADGSGGRPLTGVDEREEHMKSVLQRWIAGALGWCRIRV